MMFSVLEIQFYEATLYLIQDNIRYRREHMGNWVKYARFEEDNREFERARSVFERALEVEVRNPEIWCVLPRVCRCRVVRRPPAPPRPLSSTHHFVALTYVRLRDSRKRLQAAVRGA